MDITAILIVMYLATAILAVPRLCAYPRILLQALELAHLDAIAVLDLLGWNRLS